MFYGVNPTVAALGLGNIALYAGAYTPMKRVSAANTWVGALVGAIPPLMGWAAGAGEVEGAGVGAVGGGKGGWRELLFNFPGLTSGGFGTDGVAAAVTAPPSTAGWVLAALLFAWQFPHFCALSHPIRDEYRAAGLRMLAWTNPARNARVSLRYALLLFPLCVALAYPPDFLTGPGNSGAGGGAVVEPSFAWTTAPVNVWIAWQAARFWWAVRQSKAAAGTAAAAAGSIAGGGPGRFGIARGLFWASVWYLPLVLVLAMAQKKGLWSRLRRGLTGADHLPEDDERWEDEDEEE